MPHEDEANLIQRAAKVIAGIIKSGGQPVRRWNRVRNEIAKELSQNQKTYLDQNGVRRCNLKLKDGKTCNQPVTKKQGKYGPFWSCPNYKEHAT